MWLLSTSESLEELKGPSRKKDKKKIRGLNPRANYTDLAPAGEVSANFCGQSVPRGQRDGSLRPHSRLSRPEPLFFYFK
jgi:hypothetical protein